MQYDFGASAQWTKSLGKKIQLVQFGTDFRRISGHLIVRLALFSGMRPGEILALQWKHVVDDHVEVVQRLYRGKLDRPKSERSTRNVALSSATLDRIREWRQQSGSPDPETWVFPSAKGTTPLGRDNTWRGLLAPQLKTVQLDWATFQIMR